MPRYFSSACFTASSARFRSVTSCAATSTDSIPWKFSGCADNLDVDQGAVLLAMPPVPRCCSPRVLLRHVLQQAGNVFLRPYLRNRLSQKLLPAESVLPDRRLIHGDKAQRLAIENPHRKRVALKQQPVLLVRLAQNCSRRAAICNLPHAFEDSPGRARDQMRSVPAGSPQESPPHSALSSRQSAALEIALPRIAW